MLRFKDLLMKAKEIFHGVRLCFEGRSVPIPRYEIFPRNPVQSDWLFYSVPNMIIFVKPKHQALVGAMLRGLKMG